MLPTDCETPSQGKGLSRNSQWGNYAEVACASASCVPVIHCRRQWQRNENVHGHKLQRAMRSYCSRAPGRLDEKGHPSWGQVFGLWGCLPDFERVCRKQQCLQKGCVHAKFLFGSLNWSKAEREIFFSDFKTKMGGKLAKVACLLFLLPMHTQNVLSPFSNKWKNGYNPLPKWLTVSFYVQQRDQWQLTPEEKMQDESRDWIWVTPAIHSSMYIWPVSSHLFRSESRWLNPMQEKNPPLAAKTRLYLSPSQSTRFQKTLVRFAEAPAGKYHKKFKARFHPVIGASSSQVQEPTVQAASGTPQLPTWHRTQHGWTQHTKELHSATTCKICLHFKALATLLGLTSSSCCCYCYYYYHLPARQLANPCIHSGCSGTPVKNVGINPRVS